MISRTTPPSPPPTCGRDLRCCRPRCWRQAHHQNPLQRPLERAQGQVRHHLLPRRRGLASRRAEPALKRRAWYENSSLWVSWMQPSRTSTRPYVSDSNTCGELLPQHTEHCCVQGRALTMTSWKSDFALCSTSFTCSRSADVTAAAAAGALATTRLQRHRLPRPQAPQLGVPAVHDSANPGGVVCRLEAASACAAAQTAE